jgi:hypothetical protein
MKQREQALLLLRKAGQDEALLDAVLTSDQVSDESSGSIASRPPRRS